MALVFAVALATGAARAQSGDDRAAIRGVIQDQMAAFMRDDGAAAFAFATPRLQAMFGTPERFMGMVRGGYEPVYRPRDVRFEALEWIDGTLVQAVHVVGPDGKPVLALYSMERQPDGGWRIAGCTLVKPPGADV
jgi:hypothetical protein